MRTGSQGGNMDAQIGSLSRRRLLVGAGACGAVALGALAATKTSLVSADSKESGSTTSTAPPASLATAEMEAWIAEVGSTFRAAGQRLRLSGVQPLPLVGDRPAALRDRPFIAVLDGQSGSALAGDLIYAITHPNYPGFDIYLTSAPTAAYPRRMHALFN
jgi:hypothetical protein